MRIIRVTQTVDYLLEDGDRPYDEILNEWFLNPRYPLDSFHAYREGSRIGGSTRFLSWKEMTLKELKQEHDEKYKVAGDQS